MKVKLYKGPFNGKSYTVNGVSEIIIRGLKPMSRRQKYEWSIQDYKDGDGYPLIPGREPVIEARYRIVYRAITTESGETVSLPLYHPDGSVFYEYVEGSRRQV